MSNSLDGLHNERTKSDFVYFSFILFALHVLIIMISFYTLSYVITGD